MTNRQYRQGTLALMQDRLQTLTTGARVSPYLIKLLLMVFKDSEHAARLFALQE
jgi:hypothetical protein